jgi:hypothetical protein
MPRSGGEARPFTALALKEDSFVAPFGPSGGRGRTAGGQCAQTAMQIDQRLRNELLFRHGHSKISSPLVSAIFGLLDFASWRGLYCVCLEHLSRLWGRCISIKR